MYLEYFPPKTTFFSVGITELDLSFLWDHGVGLSDLKFYYVNHKYKKIIKIQGNTHLSLFAVVESRVVKSCMV